MCICFLSPPLACHMGTSHTVSPNWTQCCPCPSTRLLPPKPVFLLLQVLLRCRSHCLLGSLSWRDPNAHCSLSCLFQSQREPLGFIPAPRPARFLSESSNGLLIGLPRSASPLPISHSLPEFSFKSLVTFPLCLSFETWHTAFRIKSKFFTKTDKALPDCAVSRAVGTPLHPQLRTCPDTSSMSVPASQILSQP